MAMYKQISATAQIKVGFGKLTGILVSSTSSGTLKIYDSKQSSSSDPVIVNTLTPAAGSSYAFPADGINFNNGLYVVVANTIEATLMYE